MKMTVSQFLALLVLIVIVGVGAFFAATKTKGGSASGKTRQSIFLTNGQVYFGYLSNSKAQFVTLKDVYYLQVQQPLQQSQDQKSTEQPQISLVKLGNELHGPKDEMKINRDHILFTEDMKNEAKVNEAIANFVKNGATASPTPTPEPTKK